MDQKRCPRVVSSSALRMLPPGTLVNAIRSALAFVILLDCFASFLSLATPNEMPKADKAATIKIAERRKSLGFMIQVRLISRIFHLAIADFSWCKALTPCSDLHTDCPMAATRRHSRTAKVRLSLSECSELKNSDDHVARNAKNLPNVALHKESINLD
jgi:hypothetical protein